MITFENVTVKNFMSVGNVSQAVDFSKEQLTLVLGENLDQGGDDSGSRNGTGKTVIINALSYALYGQALTNIKRNNLINKTNKKGMLVTLTFQKNNKNYRIERGRSPNILKFYIDNVETKTEDDESQGDSRQTQNEINQLLEMSHDMFKHIVALNTYTEPFLSMRQNDQRAIIEQLLGITLLSQKAELLKQNIKDVKDNITEENAKLRAIESSNQRIKETIRSTTLRQKAWNTKRNETVKEITSSLSKLAKLDIEQELQDQEDLKKYFEQENKLSLLEKDKAQLSKLSKQVMLKIEKISKDISELDKNTCFTCGQDLQKEKQKEILDDKNKELLSCNDELNNITMELDKIENDILTINLPDSKPVPFYNSEKEAYEHQTNLTSIEKMLDEKINEEDPYIAQINELQSNAMQDIDWDKINKLTSFKDHQEFLLKLLTSKDSFIRKKIIDQNLSYLNNRLTYYLVKSGLPHQVKFQNDLSIEITQLGQDLDFDNLSRGERNRLILGMSWAFRDVWESLYQKINLLFIDELIDSGLDSSGVDNCLSILKKMGREGQKNVYLISHKEELIGRVTHVLKVIKENGFTSYASDLEVHGE